MHESSLLALRAFVNCHRRTPYPSGTVVGRLEVSCNSCRSSAGQTPASCQRQHRGNDHSLRKARMHLLGSRAKYPLSGNPAVHTRRVGRACSATAVRRQLHGNAHQPRTARSGASPAVSSTVMTLGAVSQTGSDIGGYICAVINSNRLVTEILSTLVNDVTVSV